MSTQHTPGPWTSNPSRDGLKVSVRQLDVSYVLGQGQIAEANARLIAAAPDLLAALKETRRWLDYWIKQAARHGTPTQYTTDEVCAPVDQADAVIAKAEEKP